MAENSYQDRTEKATPKRRQDARKKGQVAQSREIPSVMILMMSLGVFFFAGSWMFWNLAGFMSDTLRSSAQLLIADIPDATVFVLQTARTVFKILLPLLLVVFVAGLAGNVIQSGFLLSTEALESVVALQRQNEPGESRRQRDHQHRGDQHHNAGGNGAQ